MSKNTNTYQVSIILTSIGTVTVRARSAEEATRAVQRDIDSGEEILLQDILRIENDIPHSRAYARFSGIAPSNFLPDYSINSQGELQSELT